MKDYSLNTLTKNTNFSNFKEGILCIESGEKFIIEQKPGGLYVKSKREWTPCFSIYSTHDAEKASSITKTIPTNHKQLIAIIYDSRYTYLFFEQLSLLDNVSCLLFETEIPKIISEIGLFSEASLMCYVNDIYDRRDWLGEYLEADNIHDALHDYYHEMLNSNLVENTQKGHMFFDESVEALMVKRYFSCGRIDALSPSHLSPTFLTAYYYFSAFESRRLIKTIA